jgi:cytochrome b
VSHQVITMSQSSIKPAEIKVWDIAVRIFHWSLVLFFTVAYFSAELSEALHELSGYIVIGLVVFRLLWGVIGSHYARFSQFVYSKQRVAQYLRSLMRRQPEHYYGHNPAGGWAVVIMLTLLLLISYTGLELEATEGEGPLAQQSISLIKTAHADSDTEGDEEDAQHEFWEETHEFFANLMLAFVLFHIAAVLISSRLHQENLVKAMLTGRKHKVEHSED